MLEEEIRRSVEDLETVGERLLLATKQAEDPLESDQEHDYHDDPGAVSLRALLGCVVHDHLRPSIESLRRIVSTPDASPAAGNEDYTAAFERAEAWALQQFEEEQRDRQESEILFQKLQRMSSSEHRTRCVRLDYAYRRPGLVERFLAEGWSIQESDPWRAMEYAKLAAHLVNRLPSLGDEKKASAFSRSYCLDAAANRLLEKTVQAERGLVRAAGFLGTPRDRGIYCRTLALLRWDQGHLEEALALLVYGAHILLQDGLQGEARLSQALAGMLHLEKQAPWLAADALLSAGQIPESRPTLAVRSALSLAIAQTDTDFGQARSTREDARRLYPLMTSEVEIVRANWLEGRLAARLGDYEEAVELVEPAMAKLLSLGRVAEAAVAAAELVGLLAILGRVEDIPSKIAAAKEACQENRELEAASQVLDDLGSEDTLFGSRFGLRKRAFRLTLALRQALRLQGFRVEPPPAA